MIQNVEITDSVLKVVNDARVEKKLHKSSKSNISKVSFYFNDKLKAFIKDVQNVFKSDLKETITLAMERNYTSILSIQFKIRQYIILHQNKIDFITKQKLMERSPQSMPNLFGLCLLVVSNIDKLTNILDIMFQINPDYVEAVYYEQDEQEDAVCVCSHSCYLDNMYCITNNETKYTVVIGNECIKKYDLIDNTICKEAKMRTPEGVKKEKLKLFEKQVREEKKSEKLQIQIIENQRKKDVVKCIKKQQEEAVMILEQKNINDKKQEEERDKRHEYMRSNEDENLFYENLFKKININREKTPVIYDKINIYSLPNVPFGKYEGQPIKTLLNDKNYFEWCKKQEWFQKKYKI